ncbi:hypothetical protein [Brachybacterium alimentarium]
MTATTATRLETAERLAETDPYFRGYLDGLRDSQRITDRSTNR